MWRKWSAAQSEDESAGILTASAGPHTKHMCDLSGAPPRRRWIPRHRDARVLPSLLLPTGLCSSGCPSRAPDHFHVLELTALTSLVKHLANRGARKQRILCYVDSRVVLGAASKGRSSSRRLNCGLRRIAFECLSASLSIDLLSVPSSETLPTHRRGAPRSPVGNVLSRRGHLKLGLFSSGQPLSPVSSNCFANPRRPCKHRVLAINQTTKPLL